jgi:hypothetical protein
MEMVGDGMHPKISAAERERERERGRGRERERERERERPACLTFCNPIRVSGNRRICVEHGCMMLAERPRSHSRFVANDHR